MFRSARYYYRKKTYTNTEPKQRRKYIKLNPDILNMIHEHIADNLLLNDTFKPSNGYDDFYNMYYERLINDEVERISNEHNIGKEEVENKIKKTYKNKFYVLVRNKTQN